MNMLPGQKQIIFLLTCQSPVPSCRFGLGRSGLVFASLCGAARWFLLLGLEFRSSADTSASVPLMELRWSISVVYIQFSFHLPFASTRCAVVFFSPWFVRKHRVSVPFGLLAYSTVACHNSDISCSLMTQHIVFQSRLSYFSLSIPDSFFKWAVLVFQVLSNIHTVRATYNSKSPKTWSFSPRVCS